jgi:hypothetical protein
MEPKNWLNVSFKVALSLLIFHASALADDDRISLSSNPLHCTLNAKNHDTCVKLQHCSWCKGPSLPGICASDKQANALIHKIPLVKCSQEDTVEEESTALRPAKKNVPENDQALEALAPYDSKCLNAPSAAGPDDEPADICNTSTDSKGGMCVWCDAAGVFGICLSHEQAQAASSYLQCNLQVSVIV